MSLHADPGLFGRNARIGFGRHVASVPDGPIDPPSCWAPDRDEPLAAYCDGPGVLRAPLFGPADMDRRPGDLSVIAEPCPACVGLVRNHDHCRVTDGQVADDRCLVAAGPRCIKRRGHAFPNQAHAYLEDEWAASASVSDARSA